MLKECKKHGLTDHYHASKTNPNHWKCKKCNVSNVTTRRRNVREQILLEAGGKCVVCSYDRCQRALEFHHMEPGKKDFGLSAKGLTMGIDKMREEIKKCILVCSNCHREIHAGLLDAYSRVG